jgi:hypothetical protein
MNNFYEQNWGQFKDGKMNGKGTYHYADGEMCVGDWVDGEESGYCIATSPRGDRFEMSCSRRRHYYRVA